MVGYFIAMYNDRKIPIEFLLEGAVSKEVFLSFYRSCVSEKSIPPIENLPEEDKENLRNELIEVNIPVTQISAKILHTIKYINANS